LKTLQHVGFPFLANEPVLSAPVEAWKEGSAAVFKGPSANTIGCNFIVWYVSPFPVTKTVFCKDLDSALVQG